jgi:hypothetical protein
LFCVYLEGRTGKGFTEGGRGTLPSVGAKSTKAVKHHLYLFPYGSLQKKKKKKKKKRIFFASSFSR